MSRRAIVVEDDPTALALLATRVEMLGFVVTLQDRCQTVEEAVATLAQGPVPALIVLDIVLPSRTFSSGGKRANGADLASGIRQTPVFADVPIVVVSGKMPESDPDVRHAIRCGAVYLGKPHRLSAFRDAVERAGANPGPMPTRGGVDAAAEVLP